MEEGEEKGAERDEMWLWVLRRKNPRQNGGVHACGLDGRVSPENGATVEFMLRTFQSTFAFTRVREIGRW